MKSRRLKFIWDFSSLEKQMHQKQKSKEALLINLFLTNLNHDILAWKF
jgi:hypothetical protein